MKLILENIKIIKLKNLRCWMRIGGKSWKIFKEKKRYKKDRLFRRLRKSGNKLRNTGGKNSKKINLIRQIRIKWIYSNQKGHQDCTSTPWIKPISMNKKLK